MLFTLIACTVMAVAYIVYTMIEAKGIPESLSATYYLIGDNGWLFQAVMMGIGVFLLPVWLELTEMHRQWCVFLACGGLVFVGSAPAFRLELQGAIHYSAAVLCCISAVVWQILEGLWDVTLFFGFFGFMLTLTWRDRYMWFIECAVIGSLFCNLYRML